MSLDFTSEHESPLVQFNRASRVVEVALERLRGNDIGKIHVPENGVEPEVCDQLRKEFAFMSDAVVKAKNNRGDEFDSTNYDNGYVKITSLFDEILPNQDVIREPGTNFVIGIR